MRHAAAAADDWLPRRESLPAEQAHEQPPIESTWAKELRELKALAAIDPDAAITRVVAIPDQHERKAAAQAVCLVVHESNPAKAMIAAWNSELGKLADEASEHTVIEKLARQWAEADVSSVLAWAGTLPPDDESRRDRVVKGIASAVAQESPPIAASLVADSMSPESHVQIEAALEVLRRWAARDYTGALAWAALFPEGPLRDRGIEVLADVPREPPASISRAE